MSVELSTWRGGGGMKRKIWKLVSKIISGFRRKIDRAML
jgi:hypothetical protein